MPAKTYSWLLDSNNTLPDFSLLESQNQKAMWSHTRVKPSLGYPTEDLHRRSAEIIFWINKTYREHKEIMTPPTKHLLDKFRDKCCPDKTIPWTQQTVIFDSFASMSEITASMGEITRRIESDINLHRLNHLSGVRSKLEELYRAIWLIRHRDYLVGWEHVNPYTDLYKKLEEEANQALLKIRNSKVIADRTPLPAILPKTKDEAIKLVMSSSLSTIYNVGRAEQTAHKRGANDTPLNDLILEVSQMIQGYKPQNKIRDVATDLRIYAQADEIAISPHASLAQRGDWQGLARLIANDHTELRCETGIPYNERGVVTICLAKRIAPIFKKLYIGQAQTQVQGPKGTGTGTGPGCLDYEAWPCAKGLPGTICNSRDCPVIITEGSKTQIIGPEHQCICRQSTNTNTNRQSQIAPPAYEALPAVRYNLPATPPTPIPWMVESPSLPWNYRRCGIVAEFPAYSA